ncbi:uncharacterized protein DFL_003812 [Arthrobotrys flagrans]|uniref:F-box domain-containing protein n=1 Tax=Arthrobotrys flagrans TaxID=97331 RepID=A0A437A2Y8_ARTFL|nr:hypothetical protein DFL_003812 [Arthrobotrys flagrans]
MSSPPNLSRLTFTKISPQSDSHLFSLPGELRNLIWEYVLIPYNDPSRPYPSSTCYARPDFYAPLTSSVALLRTCKAIYSEAWYLPWTTAELCFYLTVDVRRPPRVETVGNVQKALDHLHNTGVDTTINHVRVFAQLCSLEDGMRLQYILNMKHFKPRSITVTIRHTDFWYWENDETLRVGGQWVGACRFPETVEKIKVEFESLERKKSQVDEIAQQAVERWGFCRADGRKLSAVTGKTEDGKVEGEMTVLRWTGSSTWEGLRWIRDEVEQGKLNYYVKTVTWRVKREQERRDEGEVDNLVVVANDPPITWGIHQHQNALSNTGRQRSLAATHTKPLSLNICTTTEEELGPSSRSSNPSNTKTSEFGCKAM